MGWGGGRHWDLLGLCAEPLLGHDEHLPSLTSCPFSASRTELYLHQVADSSSFGMGVWSKVRRRSSWVVRVGACDPEAMMGG